MKKLLFAVSALAALSLLAPSSGLAQPYYNQLGVWADNAGTQTTVQGAAGNSQVTAYVVILNPRNLETGVDLSSIKAAEWQVVLPGTMIALGLTFPVAAINIGNFTNAIVGYSTPVPVSAGACLLGTYNFLYLGVPSEVYLAPADPASVDGLMAIVDNTDTLIAAYPSSGDFAAPVFGINLEVDVVASELTTMDSVKALYR